MTLDEWIDIYNSKASLPFKRDKKYALVYLPDKGFCELNIFDDMVVINQLCGDGRYWKAQAEELARRKGITDLGTWCVRKAIKAYIRLFGFRIVEVECTSDGKERYHCLDKNNLEGLVSPAFVCDDGVQAYLITWKV